LRKRTTLNIKPDCVELPGVLQDVMSCILNYNLCIIYAARVHRSEEFWREFYYEKATDPSFPDFVGFVAWRASMPTIEFIIEGDDNVVKVVREQVLPFLRLKYQKDVRQNGFHASDSDKAAEREICLMCRSSLG